MLQSKFLYISNTSSNITSVNRNSSSIPNTLFELMRDNILIVNSPDVEQLHQEDSIVNQPVKKVLK